MRPESLSPPPAADARQWPKLLAPYREPRSGRSIAEILITALPLIVLWVAMWASLSVGYWLCLLLAVPAAGFLVRLFMIQHDCSHGSFFRRRAANDWVGRVIGVFTLTPHDLWQRSHAMHHAGSGNLAHRGIGDVTTKTVSEYRALDWRGRLGYRLYRHPVVLFGLGPAYLFWIQHRWPVGMMRKGWQPWLSSMLTNLGIVMLAGGVIWLTGLGAFLMVQMPITIIASSIGVWLFYVQHQFEHTTWEADADWSHPVAALHGSSHYDLPAVLRWFTANIGVHHVHHLSSRIPFYRLPEVLRNHPELADIGRLGLLESFRCVRLVLWDEGRRRLVSFREMWRNASAEGAAG
jgi:omega-6 fatty acid desaturase (delta-12 desaturase)